MEKPIWAYKKKEMCMRVQSILSLANNVFGRNSIFVGWAMRLIYYNAYLLKSANCLPVTQEMAMLIVWHLWCKGVIFYS
jgi:hypothetical protein